ncbi:MAG: hypothetical protein AAFP69_20855, partial [Planctomycetota bacterium]
SGKLDEDPIAETGASLRYLQIDLEIFPNGQQVDVRSNIEEALQEAFDADDTGRVVGGAFGWSGAYIDLILTDGERSQAVVDKTLHDLQLAERSKQHSFA